MGLAKDPRWGWGMATCSHPQIILMLTEKCHKQQEGRVETDQLRFLLSELEQKVLQLQKEKEALRWGPRWADSGSRQEPISLWPHDAGQ